MNEIKFRAWDGERLRKVNTIGWVDEGVDFVTTPRYSGPAEDFRLMQYTGLKDKNGVEIYEGDVVVAWSSGVKGTFVIKWRQEGSPSWILYPAWQNSEFWNLHGSLHNDGQYYDKGLEVIGNIYENPELLEREGK